MKIVVSFVDNEKCMLPCDYNECLLTIILMRHKVCEEITLL